MAVGTQTVARGHAAMATGCATKAVNDNTFTAGIGTEATGDGAAAVGQRTKASGRAAFAGGQMAEAAGDYSAAFGNQVKTAAKHSMLTGRHGELADTPENDGAFAVAAGAVKAPHLALKVFGNRSVKNPLYGQEGEREYIPEPDAGIEVGGHILAGTVIVSGAVLQLDHGRAGRWKITPGTTVTPTLKNWRDGDVGELVIYNGGSKVNFPAAWKWVGTIPTLKTAGVDVFTIRQIDNIIFIKHEVTA